MKDLSSYLNRFSRALNLKTNEIKIIQESVKEVFSIEIKKESITIKEKTVYISTTPAFKNQLFINKESLIKKFHEKGLLFITDLR
jgi:hypothetical protein